MFYPVMNVTQCEGQLSSFHFNSCSMTTPQSEEKITKNVHPLKRSTNILLSCCYCGKHEIRILLLMAIRVMFSKILNFFPKNAAIFVLNAI